VLFPWGVTNANDYTPLRHLFAYRDESYFLGHFQPQFNLPKVLVVIPKAHVMKDQEAVVPYGWGFETPTYVNGIMNALFEHEVQFAVIDDVDLDKLPNEPRVLIYPDPVYASNEVLTKLRSRVMAGDDLFLTGDFSQPLEAGGERQTKFFSELAGLRWLADYPAGSEIPIVPVEGGGLVNPYLGHPLSKFQAEGGRALATDSAGNVITAMNELGRGHVFFTSDGGLDGARRGLDVFLAMRSVPSVAMSPKMPHREIFEIDREGGGKIYTLLATNPGGEEAGSAGPWIEHPESFVVNVGGKNVHLPLGVYGVSLFAVREDGSIDALEGQGKFSVDGTELLDAQPHVMAMALDDVPLTKSHAVALFPIGAGRISIAAPSDVDLVEVGELVADQLHPLEEIATSRQEGRLTFQIDDVQSRGVLLITSKTNRDHARQLMNAALQ
jgi:hypothetical protein